MANEPKRPGKTEHVHGPIDTTKAALSEQVYEAVFKPALDALLKWAKEEQPELYHQFCSLWQRHPTLMRNELVFFVSVIEGLSHLIPMPEVFRNVGEGGLEHLPVATLRFMEGHLKDVQFPTDFQPPKAVESLKVNWRMLTRGDVLDAHFPMLERLRRAISPETIQTIQRYGEYAAVGLGRGVDAVRAGYRSRRQEPEEHAPPGFLRRLRNRMSDAVASSYPW